MPLFSTNEGDIDQLGLEIDVVERRGRRAQVPQHALGIGKMQALAPVGRALAHRARSEQLVLEADLQARIGARTIDRIDRLIGRQIGQKGIADRLVGGRRRGLPGRFGDGQHIG
jgi:hypothetical protein